ncbi:capsular biosynthesis protein [Novosphingobium sp. Leaf2]|uniref:capsule biosynthesis protein n=1 Tax=Novosphingobium sp. Leaf2 TaxID=1735670 RepID=UPI0009EB6FA2
MSGFPAAPAGVAAAPIDSAADTHTAPGKRTVLMLQGLMGPLFRKLGLGLIAAGHTVHKINFNGGDRLFWRLPNGIDYRGSLEDWPGWLEQVIRERGVTDVTLFGDCRDHHMPAIRLCRDLGVPVHVFEEGYIRPDWVTLELGGVNGHSSLPRDPAWYRETAAALPPVPPHAQVPSSFRRRAIEGLLYNAADVLTRWHYPHWSNHRPWHPLVEAMGWVRKLRRRKEREASSIQLLHDLEASGATYFLFPLQLDSDAQIRLHSPFAGIADALRLIIGSFAAHAPLDVRLVVKEHPLDNGVRDWRQETADTAELFGVADRVDYLAWGDIVPVTQRARGVVTINSTSGTFALATGVPVVALGHAVYDIADITYQKGIDAFWADPVAPDVQTFAAFRRVLVERCLIPGGFFSDEALDKVVRHAIARFEGRALLPE